MARFKNMVSIEIEFLSMWPDRVDEVLREMTESADVWATKYKISLNSIRKKAEVESVSE